ncbi:MAG: hypothetical protein OXC28_24035, partial [Defluviicoccus sp.]|nr:hypothetical protein [Defluviicoccus sp.]
MEEVDNLDRTPRATPSAGGRPADAPEKGGEALACEDLTFRPRCLSIDLEVGRNDGRIRAFGAVRGDTGEGFSGGGTVSDLSMLDELAEGADFVLGHNLIAFDLPHLAAASPSLRLLR